MLVRRTQSATHGTKVHIVFDSDEMGKLLALRQDMDLVGKYVLQVGAGNDPIKARNDFVDALNDRYKQEPRLPVNVYAIRDKQDWFEIMDSYTTGQPPSESRRIM